MSPRHIAGNDAKPAERQIETHTLVWRDRTIEIIFEADWLGSSKSGNPNFARSHLTLRTVTPERAPLPMTGTGYRSHFIPMGTVEQHGGVLAFVSAWLDEEAQSPEWKAIEEAEKQPSLFGAL